MGKSLILFLSGLFILLQGSGQSAFPGQPLDCTDRHIHDSLVKKYITNGADKLPNMYNNPAWQSYCDSIIAICPQVAEAYQLKAVPFIKNGEYEKAFALYDITVQLDPKRYTGHRGFIKCLFTKDYEGAMVDLQQAQQLTPNGYDMDHTYKFYEGLCNLELGNYTAAEQNFKQDISIQASDHPADPPHFNTLLFMGILYYEMGKDAQAKEFLLNCLNVYKQHPEGNYYLALVFQREGNAAMKKKYLEIAKKSYSDGYRMNEDQLYYVNYPHGIKLYEIEEALGMQ